MRYLNSLKGQKVTIGEGYKEGTTRCQVPLNFYKQTNTYLQIVNVVVE